MARVPVCAGVLAGVLLGSAWARAEGPATSPEPVPPAYAPPSAAPAAPVAPLPPVAPIAPASDDELPGHPRPVPRVTGVGMLPSTASPTSARDGVGLEAIEHRAPKQRYLYQRWPFWVVAGGLVVGMIVLTYAVTRPPPQPYNGNTVGNFNFP